MKLASKNFAILSAEKSALSVDENRERSEKLEERLKMFGCNFEKAYGRYDGITETSFIVYDVDPVTLMFLKLLAFNTFRQESILIQDSNGVGRLIYSHRYIHPGAIQVLGQYKEIGIFESLKVPAFTQLAGQRFVYA